MSPSDVKLAIIHCSARVRKSPAEIEQRLEDLKREGFSLVHLEPEKTSADGTTAGPALERATLLAHALTNRRYPTIWAARGGSGATELIPYLEQMLPPVLPPKRFVGFSDVSFLGCYLATRFPNLTYIHGNHCFDSHLFQGSHLERQTLWSLLKGETPAHLSLPLENGLGSWGDSLSGPCVPLNLSLAESLACLRHITLPPGNILFLEDVGEESYRLLRKLDSLINSGFLSQSKAIVIGEFALCPDASGKPMDENHLARLFHAKTRLPVFLCRTFGHGRARLPLVFGAPIRFVREGNHRHGLMEVRFASQSTGRVSTPFAATLHLPPALDSSQNGGGHVHFTGIGGTGMAAVAGLCKAGGFTVTGSDMPIYPPMDKVISDLGITPVVGFHATTIAETRPDAVVLANVVSRRNAKLEPNEELEFLLGHNLPLLSFPSLLRKLFLHKSTNIVVSGTHGKTTTTSLLAHTLRECGLRPSYFIGGAPKTLPSGFALDDGGMFVLEGDEYDSAFFDKGPKYLHYEPSVTLMNNIEFDHADIYPDLAAIEAEFARLAALTGERGGVVVANLEDQRVRTIARASGCAVIGFRALENNATPVDTHCPTWTVESYTTETRGLKVTLRAPDGTVTTYATGVFGRHNALNLAGALASLQALACHGAHPGGVTPEIVASFCARSPDVSWWARVGKGLESFTGVKRRFELLGTPRDIAIFDDFAHHPTAIDTTLGAFRDYIRASGRSGRLIACFDPRNATMRRRVMQEQLARSFTHADVVYFGKVPRDLRLPQEEQLDGPGVASACGSKAQYFDDNDRLCEELARSARAGDTVVFMSSGAFDGLPIKLTTRLAN